MHDFIGSHVGLKFGKTKREWCTGVGGNSSFEELKNPSAYMLGEKRASGSCQWFVPVVRADRARASGYGRTLPI